MMNETLWTVGPSLSGLDVSVLFFMTLITSYFSKISDVVLMTSVSLAVI